MLSSPSFIQFVCSPETNVMALFWTVANRLLKGEVFLAPEKIQTADRSFIVWPSENRIDDDPRTAPESQWIGGIPAGGDKGTDDVFFRTDKRDVERIARNSAGSMGEGGATAQIRMLSLVTFPEPRGEEVGPEKVDDRERKDKTQPVDVSHNFVFRRSSRSGTACGWHAIETHAQCFVC